MMAELLLGIDVGTYSSKGVLVTPAGEVVKSAVVEHGLDIPQAGWAEQDADAVWWHDVKALCRKLLDKAPYSGKDVAAVALSAIGPCLVPLDGQGRPLRKGILYGIDTRASEEIALLNAELGEADILDFSGMALTSQAIGPKILWLKRREPEIWAQTARLTTASSYLVYRLTGEHVIDRHTASHYMPLFDIRSLQWSERFAAAIAPLSMLPRLAWSDEQAGEVTQTAAAETGLQPGTPVAVGAVDALSEAISVGVTQPGDLMIMYGSTTFFILVLDRPLPNPTTWTTAGAFAGQYNLAAGMATTGALTRWFRDELGKDLPADEAYAALFAEAKAIPAGAEGLLVLPYFSGERTPINDPKARGVIAGLSLHHRRAHLFRAVLEGVSLGIRDNLEAFRALGAPITRLVAVGGGTKGDTWVQITSDVTGEPQALPVTTIGASFGDAFLAGLVGGHLKHEDLARWVGAARTVTPDPTLKPLYDARYALYRHLYSATREIVHALA